MTHHQQCNNVTERSLVEGNNTTVTLHIAGVAILLFSFPPFHEIADPIQGDCDYGKHFQCFVIQQSNTIHMAGGLTCGVYGLSLLLVMTINMLAMIYHQRVKSTEKVK